MMRPDWVKPYHDKLTEGWINHVYPVNKGTFGKEAWGQTKRGVYRDLPKPWLKGTEEMEAPSKSFKMILSRLGHYFINVVAPESQYDTKESPLLNATVALDPGERSPWVAYDVDGRVIDIDSGVMDAKIFYLLYCVDRIRAKMARMARTAAKGKRRRLRHAYLRKHQKVWNLVDNVHRQVIAWLTQSMR